MIEHEAADSYPPAPNLARKVADLAASIEAKDAEIERLRGDLSFWKRHAPAEIARMRRLVEHYQTDTELQSTRRLLAARTDQRDEKNTEIVQLQEGLKFIAAHGYTGASWVARQILNGEPVEKLTP